jgi:enediyne biosynthesis protein E4
MKCFLPGGLCLALLSLLGLAAGCRQADPPADEPEATGPAWFADVTEEVGLHFVHDAGPVGDYFMPQQVGSGAALFDFDNDGRLDVYLLQNGGPGSKSTNRLFRQLPGGRFQDVSAESGLDIGGYNMGVAVGDVNNDGWADVLVTCYDGVKLFLNQGDGTFQDVTREAGLSNPAWGTSAAFFDYDRDGRLDLVVVNYVDYDPTWPCRGPDGTPDYCAPKTFKGRVSRLFHNLGPPPPPKTSAKVPGVRFQDVTESCGLGRVPGPGLGVICADFSGDGWPDIFVANDGQPNRLWVNQKDGTFKEEAVQRGLAYNAMAQAQAGMGVALGDVDGDGLLDLFVTHLTEETHTLWRQGPPGLFQDRTAESGLLRSAWRGTGFGTLLADFDHDGWPDLAVVNGRVSARASVADWSLGPFWSRYGDRNQLFRNGGAGQFADVSRSNPAFCGRENVARGLVRGDIDGDGAMDLLVTTIGGPARLFKNVAPKRGHWLRVRALLAVGPGRWRDAVGAEVRVRVGDRTLVGWLHPAESYLCSSEPVAHFGLGAAGRVDAIEVVWPDGSRQTFPGGDADREVKLCQGGPAPAGG